MTRTDRAVAILIDGLRVRTCQAQAIVSLMDETEVSHVLESAAMPPEMAHARLIECVLVMRSRLALKAYEEAVLDAIDEADQLSRRCGKRFIVREGGKPR